MQRALLPKALPRLKAPSLHRTENDVERVNRGLLKEAGKEEGGHNRRLFQSVSRVASEPHDGRA